MQINSPQQKPLVFKIATKRIMKASGSDFKDKSCCACGPTRTLLSGAFQKCSERCDGVATHDPSGQISSAHPPPSCKICRVCYPKTLKNQFLVTVLTRYECRFHPETGIPVRERLILSRKSMASRQLAGGNKQLLRIVGFPDEH
jgi:hypothetical protein